MNTKYIAESCCESVMVIGIKVQRFFVVVVVVKHQVTSSLPFPPPYPLSPRP